MEVCKCDAWRGANGIAEMEPPFPSQLKINREPRFKAYQFEQDWKEQYAPKLQKSGGVLIKGRVRNSLTESATI